MKGTHKNLITRTRLWTSQFTALAWPPRCAGCRNLLPDSHRWCPDCWTDLALLALCRLGPCNGVLSRIICNTEHD